MREPLSLRKAAEVIKSATRGSGKLLILPHCQEELAADGFDVNDLLAAVRAGAVFAVEEEHGAWRYKLQGPPVDQSLSKDVVIVFEIDIGGENPAIAITAFSVKARGARSVTRPALSPES